VVRVLGFLLTCIARCIFLKCNLLILLRVVRTLYLFSVGRRYNKYVNNNGACFLNSANRVHNIDPSRSSKVVDFGTNRKRVSDFLTVLNSNLGPILQRLRY